MATLIAIMGRESAYTGKAVTWDEMMASTQRLGPTQDALGPVSIPAQAPVPGIDHGPPLNPTKSYKDGGANRSTPPPLNSLHTGRGLRLQRAVPVRCPRALECWMKKSY